jgi:hypothetical protein
MAEDKQAEVDVVELSEKDLDKVAGGFTDKLREPTHGTDHGSGHHGWDPISPHRGF